MAATRTKSPEERAQDRTRDFNGVLWHTVTFVIINAMLWLIDIAGGSGVDWAFWVTIFWGIGLLFHISWYVIDVARSGRRYEKFLADERRKDA
jgi:hypothetical protein